EDGKLFPDTNRSRTVLDALLNEAARLGITINTDHRVTATRKDEDAFAITCVRRADPSGSADSEMRSRAVVIATGGRSLPKTGSDGVGYDLVRRLGHGYVETTPALAPLVLDGYSHERLAGVAHRAILGLRMNGRMTTRLEGSLLWTHFGMSGPVVLNMSRHWHRAMLDVGRARPFGRAAHSVEVLVNLVPSETFESLETWWLEQERERPRAQVTTILATRVPSAVADVWLDVAGIGSDVTMAHLGRDARRRLIRALVEAPVAVVD